MTDLNLDVYLHLYFMCLSSYLTCSCHVLYLYLTCTFLVLDSYFALNYLFDLYFLVLCLHLCLCLTCTHTCTCTYTCTCTWSCTSFVLFIYVNYTSFKLVFFFLVVKPSPIIKKVLDWSNVRLQVALNLSRSEKRHKRGWRQPQVEVWGHRNTSCHIFVMVQKRRSYLCRTESNQVRDETRGRTTMDFDPL